MYSDSLSEYMTENEIYKYIYELTTALDYCHERNIIHRGISPLLLSYHQISNHRIFSFPIIIFYLVILVFLRKFNTVIHSMSLSLSWLIPSASDVGTSIYKAPETFLGGEYDLKKSDISFVFFHYLWLSFIAYIFSMGISILQIISDYNLEHESEVGIPGVLVQKLFLSV